MVGVADKRYEMTRVGVAPRLGMNLGDERTDGVDDPKSALLAVLSDRRRDAMRGEHAELTGGNLVLAVHEHRAKPFETADDMVVVHDLMSNVDRRTMLGEQALDDLDRAVDPRAKGS